MLASAIGEARVITDPAGNSKLAKGTEGGRRLRARDDAAAAAILAVGLAERQPQADRKHIQGISLMASWYTRNGIQRKVWSKIRLKVLERDNRQCVRCGRYGRLEVDHDTPLHLGGDKYALENLNALCRGCHRQKTKSDNAVLYTVKPEVAAWRELIENRKNDIMPS